MSKDKFINNVPDFDFIFDDGGIHPVRNGRIYTMTEYRDFYRHRIESYKTNNLSAIEMMILAGRQKQPTIIEQTLF